MNNLPFQTVNAKLVSSVNIYLRVSSILLAIIVLICMIRTVYNFASNTADAIFAVCFYFPFYGLIQAVTLVIACCVKRSLSQGLLIVATLISSLIFFLGYHSSSQSHDPQWVLGFFVFVFFWSLLIIPLFWGGVIIVSVITRQAR